MTTVAVEVVDSDKGATIKETSTTMARNGFLYIFINPMTGRPTNLSYIVIGVVIVWIVYATKYRDDTHNPKLTKGENLVRFDETNNVVVQPGVVSDYQEGAGASRGGFNPDLIPFQHLVHPHQRSQEAIPADLSGKIGVPQDKKKVPNERQNIPRPKPKDFPVDILLEPEWNAIKCPVTTFMLIVVATLPSEATLRNSIRRTWGSPANFDELRITGLTWKMVFALGTGNDEEDEKIRKESEKYGDIIQGRFADTGVEDTRKTMMVFKWISYDLSKHAGCHPAYVLKAPAKVYIHIPYVLDWIAHDVKHLQDVYRGKLLRRDVPIRTPEDPLYVSKEDFLGDTFPDMIRGPVYLLSTDVVDRMVERFAKITPIAMEDSYLGLLANDMDVKPVNDEHFLLMARPRNICHYKKMMFVYDVAPAEQVHVFNVVERGHLASECRDDRGL